MQIWKTLRLALGHRRPLPSASLLMLILPDGFKFNADPNPILTHRDDGRFGNFRVLGKTTTAPVCDFEECAGLYQDACPSSPLFTCTTLVLEKNNANDWPSGTSFQLILHRLDLRRSAGDFGSLLLTTITKSRGTSVLLDTGAATLRMKAGDLTMTQFDFAPLKSASPISLDASFTVGNTLTQNDGVEICFPPEFLFPTSLATAIHLASGTSYGLTTSTVSVTYVDGGQLTRASTGNVTIRPALMFAADSVQFALGGLRSIHISGATGKFHVSIIDAYGLLVEETLIDGVYLQQQTPVVSRLIASNVAKAGGMSVTVAGNHFGFVDFNPSITGLSAQRLVTVGSTSCLHTSWVAYTALTCGIMQATSRPTMCLLKLMASKCSKPRYSRMILTSFAPSHLKALIEVRHT